MADVPDPTGPAAATPRQRGWFMRLPLWVRIAVPAVLAILLVGGTVAVISAMSRPTDPVEVARSLCQSGVRDDIESRGDTLVDEPFFADVITAEADVIIIQGSLGFTEADGSVQRAQVRCTVRVEDGRMRVTGIRYGG